MTTSDPNRRHSIAYAGSIAHGPRYWAPEQALKLDPRAISAYDLVGKPLEKWTLKQKLEVALATLQWDKHDDQRRREVASRSAPE